MLYCANPTFDRFVFEALGGGMDDCAALFLLLRAWHCSYSTEQSELD